jgi:hypothetical protein
MNLALSALIILLFLLPAFSFRIGVAVRLPRQPTDGQDAQEIISRNVSKALSKLTFTDTVFFFSIVPIVLHCVSLWFIQMEKLHIDYAVLLNIFSGKQDLLKGGSSDYFNQELLSFLLYTLAETIIAFVLGLGLVWWLGGKKWLLKVLVGNNVWFKLFTGTTLTKAQKKELAQILVEVLVETKETTVLYSGLLKFYETTDNSDELSCVILTAAFRRDLRKQQLSSTVPQGHETKSSSAFDDQYGDIIPIPGHSFTISGKDIINVNVTYMRQAFNPTTKKQFPEPIAFG